MFAIAVAAGIGVVWAVSGGSDPAGGSASDNDRSPLSASESLASPDQQSSRTPAPTDRQSSRIPAPTVEEERTDLPVPLDPVPLDQPAEFGDQVSAELVDLLAVQAEGQVAGEISGPALRVTVRLINGTGEPLSLDGVTVAMYFGPELVPAPPISDPGTAPFSGSLAPGDSSQGVYTFSIAENERDDVSVTVSHSAASAIVVFTGAVS